MMPAGALANDGDMLEIVVMLSTTPDGWGTQIRFAGNIVSSPNVAFDQNISVRIVRISNTEVMVQTDIGPVGGPLNGFNFSGSTHNIDVEVSDSAPGTTLLHAFNVLRFKV